jgi:hypothetical protein
MGYAKQTDQLQLENRRPAGRNGETTIFGGVAIEEKVTPCRGVGRVVD